MSASVYKVNGTGTGNPILFGAAVPAGHTYRLVSVSCKFKPSAPTTSEDFTITLDAHAGAVYDVLLYSVDPSAGATTDIDWSPPEEKMLEGGDAVDVAFTNTDARQWGVQVTLKRLA